MTRLAAKSAFQQAKVTPQDISIVELHDCFTTNQMCALEGLGLAEEGKAWKLIQDGGITYSQEKERGLSGKGWIVNPSGGLISKGHPLGATGLAQCAELGMNTLPFPFYRLQNSDELTSLASPRLGNDAFRL
jgi:sterol carrier protein 2